MRRRIAGQCWQVQDASPHLVLIPVQPSPFDVWACADLVEMIDARRAVTGDKLLAFFVVSRAIKNTKLSAEVSASCIPLLPARGQQS